MVGVPVAAVGVVRHDHLGTYLVEHGEQLLDLFGHRSPHESARMLVRFDTRHTRVTPTAGPAEEPVLRPAQRHPGLGQFADSVAAELVTGPRTELLELGGDDLPLLTEGAGHHCDVRPFGRVAGDGPARGDALVVWVCVNEQHPAAVYRGHNLRLVP